MILGSQETNDNKLEELIIWLPEIMHQYKFNESIIKLFKRNSDNEYTYSENEHMPAKHVH